MQGIFSGWSWLSEAASISQDLICTNDRVRNERFALRDLVLTNLMRLTLLANWLHKQKHRQAHRSRLVRENQRNLSVKGGIPEISAKPTLCQFFNRSSFTFMCRAHHWVWLPAHTSWDAHTYIHIRVWNNFYVEEKHCLLFFSYTVSPSFLG